MEEHVVLNAHFVNQTTTFSVYYRKQKQIVKLHFELKTKAGSFPLEKKEQVVRYAQTSRTQ